MTLLERVQLANVSVPKFRIAPPLAVPTNPLVSTSELNVAVTAPTLKIRELWLPFRRTGLAKPEPSMVSGLFRPSSPDVRVIVLPDKLGSKRIVEFEGAEAITERSEPAPLSFV